MNSCFHPGFPHHIAGKAVTGGTVRVSVQGRGRFSWLKLDKTYDLCSVVPTQCPISAGPLTLSIQREIPKSPVVSWHSHACVCKSATWLEDHSTIHQDAPKHC